MSKLNDNLSVFSKSKSEICLNTKIYSKLNQNQSSINLNPEHEGFHVNQPNKNKYQDSQSLVQFLQNESQHNVPEVMKPDYSINEFQKSMMEKIGYSKNDSFGNYSQKFEKMKYERDCERKSYRIAKSQKNEYLKAKLLQLQLIKSNLNALKGQMHKTLDFNRESFSEKRVIKNQYYLNNLLTEVDKQENQEKRLTYFHHFNKNFRNFVLLHKRSQSSIKNVQFIEISRLIINSSCNLPSLILDIDNNAFFKIKKWNHTSSGFPIYLKSDTPGISSKFQVVFRPSIKKFLSECSKKYVITMLSTSCQQFVKQISSYIDSKKILISKVLYCRQAVDKSKFFIKDLSTLSLNMKRTLIVSNQISNYPIKYKNLVPLIPFQENSQQKELEKLQGYLRNLSSSRDLAESNGIYFKYQNFIRSLDSKQLTHELIRSQFQS